MTRPRVGIDLAPAGCAAPGTARHVAEQARALFALDLGWDWVPLVEGKNNPLWEEAAAFEPEIVAGSRVWTRATLQVGTAWKRRGCRLGFATAYFVPWVGLPVVTNFFDSNVFEHGDTWIQSGRRWNLFLIRALSTFAILRARRLFILSEYCRAYMAARFPHAASKFVVTPCGVTPPAAAPAVAPAWAGSLQKPFFLYVGVFSENKNQRRLLDAWAQLQGAHPDLPALVLIGSCPPDYAKTVIQPALAALPRPDQVIYAGKVPDSELAWAYRNASAYLQPSIAEGFGLPVIEAMACGLPVACSNTTSLPEIAGDAALLFDPFDVNSMAAAIVRLWKDEPLREQLRSLGMERSRIYRWENHAALVALEIEAVLRTL
jgi:glycosyltransferase involved in cell wall biosynthesis